MDTFCAIVAGVAFISMLIGLVALHMRITDLQALVDSHLIQPHRVVPPKPKKKARRKP